MTLSCSEKPRLILPPDLLKHSDSSPLINPFNPKLYALHPHLCSTSLNSPVSGCQKPFLQNVSYSRLVQPRRHRRYSLATDASVAKKHPPTIPSASSSFRRQTGTYHHHLTFQPDHSHLKADCSVHNSDGETRGDFATDGQAETKKGP